MPEKALFYLAILFTTIAMAAGLAHLFELPNKIHLPADDYLTVQQIYRGWALLGIAVMGALICTTALSIVVRGTPAFALAVTAAMCVALSLIVFFLYTYPANQATANWTMLPDDWETLRTRWEYSHAVGAGLYFVAFNCLIAAVLRGR